MYTPAVFERSGVLAQLVERLNGIEEVSGSSPLCSTTQSAANESLRRFLIAYSQAFMAF